MLRNQLKLLLLNASIYFPALPHWTAPVVSAYRRAIGGPREKGLRALEALVIPESGSWVDVGGSVGEGAAAMRAQAPSAPIVSFEPNPFFAAKLRSRFRKDPGVRVESVALGDAAGSFPLYIPVYKRVAFPELGTLHRCDAESWLCDRVFRYHREELMILEVSCKLETLDAFHLAPALIKIDCRCDAAEVLAGGRETVFEHHPVVLLQEVPTEERIFRELAKSGYQAFAWSKDHLAEVAPGEPCNVLAMNDHVKPSRVRRSPIKAERMSQAT